MVKVTDCIAKPFYPVYWNIIDGDYSHYWLGGGRGSMKSSFASIIIIQKIMKEGKRYLADTNNPKQVELLHAVCFRKVKDTLKDSVYEQLLWAIEKLGVSDYFSCTTHPLQITYKPTGQKILFRGLDKAEKAKSIKVSKGYFGLTWFEELQEFHGVKEVRKAYQSVMRGTDEPMQAICTYNPPQEIQNWVNVEELKKNKHRLVHKSTYLEVPEEWLGQQFIKDAEDLKASDYLAYQNEYLGMATGSGGKIFRNIIEKEFTEDDYRHFTNVRYGLDWGFAVDPLAFVKMHYDTKKRDLYIYDEVYKTGLTNDMAMIDIHPKIDDERQYVTADSAEPKSIQEFNQGTDTPDGKFIKIRTIGAKKGKDSVSYGIKSLQRFNNIYIDPVTAPNAFKEFSTYEFERDKNGDFKSNYPDKNNHAIDAVRYGLESDLKAMYNKQSRPSDWVGIGL